MRIEISRSSRARRKLAAFSLVETAVGMAVIGAVLGAMLSGIVTGTFTMRLARENLRATQIMLEKVETIRLYSWDQVTTNFIPSSFTNVYDPVAPTGQQGLAYIGTLTIGPAPFNCSYSDSVRQVTVNLNWQTGGLQRNRTFTSLIARNGLQDYIY